MDIQGNTGNKTIKFLLHITKLMYYHPALILNGIKSDI